MDDVDQNLSTPVLMVVFNRPENTRRVFEAVRAARPERLYLAADGPRADRPGETGSTAATRAVVLEHVDWPCEVKTLLRDENLGVKRAVGGAIDWFFEQEEHGIILEDDCLPDQSFFPYCEELLDRYRDDQRVWQIGGNCYLKDRPESPSYFFSKYPHIWGWATWRDRWQNFSTTTDDFEAEFTSFSDIFTSEKERDHWHRHYRDYFDGKWDSWAYGWTWTVWKNHGLATYPTVNLVKNIGFGDEAVHTKSWRDHRGLRKARLESIGTLQHPPKVELDRELDQQDFRIFFEKRNPIVLAFKLLGSIAASVFERLFSRFR